jgi:hypothetical protein
MCTMKHSYRSARNAWCKKYKKHPYAWGALLMIHGTNEVSGRLRARVENYAVYSRLGRGVLSIWKDQTLSTVCLSLL